MLQYGKPTSNDDIPEMVPPNMDQGLESVSVALAGEFIKKYWKEMTACSTRTQLSKLYSNIQYDLGGQRRHFRQILYALRVHYSVVSIYKSGNLLSWFDFNPKAVASPNSLQYLLEQGIISGDELMLLETCRQCPSLVPELNELGMDLLSEQKLPVFEAFICGGSGKCVPASEFSNTQVKKARHNKMETDMMELLADEVQADEIERRDLMAMVTPHGISNRSIPKAQAVVEAYDAAITAAKDVVTGWNNYGVDTGGEAAKNTNAGGSPAAVSEE